MTLLLHTEQDFFSMHFWKLLFTKTHWRVHGTGTVLPKSEPKSHGLLWSVFASTLAETWDYQNMRDHSHFFKRNKFLLNSIHSEVILASASRSRMLIPEMSQSPLGESTSQEGERVNLHSTLYYLADKLIHYLPSRKK